MSTEQDQPDTSIQTKARRITLDAQLARAARQHPERVAFKFDGREMSYHQLDERVTALANAMIASGLNKGDRVAVMMQNCIEVIEAYLAIIRAGGICVPVNFRLRNLEIDYILAQSRSAMVILDSPSAEVLSQCRGITDKILTITVRMPGGSILGQEYEQIISGAALDPIGVEVGDYDPAFIMYTSGTTGRPKGAVLTHMNLLVNTMNMIASLEIAATDRRWLAGLPLFHIGGLNGILPFLYLGGTSVILPNGNFEARIVADLLERERITSCFFVPTQWQAICEVEGIADRVPCLERVTWGASVCPASVTASIHQSFPRARTYNVFGQTEMSSVTCAMRADRFPDKSDAIGTPVPGVEVRIVDEEMRDVPDGVAGEIIYRGPTVMQGYWEMPEATAEAFRGGWFHSGDLVRRDQDSFYYIVDRIADMIISGGENIYSPEVEAVIGTFPGVREVAIVGAPHAKWIETPVAFVAQDSGADICEAEIIAWCKERLASYKKPTSVHFVSALPRNASGKVLKTELKNLLLNLIEAHGASARDA